MIITILLGIWRSEIDRHACDAAKAMGRDCYDNFDRYWPYNQYTKFKEIKPDQQLITICIMFLIFLKATLGLVYTEALGELVQIILRMIEDSIRFLFLFTILMVFFAVIGHMLYYDLDEFESFPQSFTTMYQAALGDFDFSIFDGRYFDDYVGRIYMCIYLLISAILLLNFLIAIMSDTFTRLSEYDKGLQMIEIVNMRALYDNDPYYSSLHKGSTFATFACAPLNLIVVFSRSKRLNTLNLAFQAWGNAGWMRLVLCPFMLILTMIKCFVLLGYKTVLLFKKGKNVCVKIIDYVFTLILFPFILLYTMICSFSIYWINLFRINHIQKVVEIYKTEHEFINAKMDGSVKDNEDIANDVDAQVTYYQFKKYVDGNKQVKNAYDPGNSMISEVVLLIMVGAIKILKNRIRADLPNSYPNNTVPMYLPVSYVVKELHKYMHIGRHLKALIFSTDVDPDDYDGVEEVNELAAVLADDSVGGIYKTGNDEEPNYEEDGNNILLFAAKLKNYNQRLAFWKQKLCKLFAHSNKQWLLDQFKYCKWFLFKNSMIMESEEIPDISKAKTLVERLANHDRAKMLKAKRDMYWLDKKLFKKFNNHHRNKIARNRLIHQLEIEKREETTVMMLNLTSMVAYYDGFWMRIKSMVKDMTSNGEKELSQYDEEKLAEKTKTAMTRFASSCLGSNFNATETFFNQ